MAKLERMTAGESPVPRWNRWRGDGVPRAGVPSRVRLRLTVPTGMVATAQVRNSDQVRWEDHPPKLVGEVGREQGEGAQS